jgi:hypothetical protein
VKRERDRDAVVVSVLQLSVGCCGLSCRLQPLFSSKALRNTVIVYVLGLKSPFDVRVFRLRSDRRPFDLKVLLNT